MEMGTQIIIVVFKRLLAKGMCISFIDKYLWLPFHQRPESAGEYWIITCTIENGKSNDEEYFDWLEMIEFYGFLFRMYENEVFDLTLCNSYLTNDLVNFCWWKMSSFFRIKINCFNLKEGFYSWVSYYHLPKY